jgi:hypothetical protein
MLLSPDRISYEVREEMGERGVRQDEKPEAAVLPVRAGRLVPHSRIVERTGLTDYEGELGFAGLVEPERVSIPLSQHVGAPARPVVRIGDGVERGQVIGEADKTAVGARVHASIDGVVTDVDHAVVVEKG